MIKRYLVHPGPIRSKTDGDIHHITFGQLVKLYGVKPGECINAAASGAREILAMRPDALPELIDLRPRFSGDYTLPGQDRKRGKPEIMPDTPEQVEWREFMEKRGNKGNAVLREPHIAEAIEDGKPNSVIFRMIRIADACSAPSKV